MPNGYIFSKFYLIFCYDGEQLEILERLIGSKLYLPNQVLLLLSSITIDLLHSLSSLTSFYSTRIQALSISQGKLKVARI